MNIKTTSSKIKKVKSYLKKQKANLALKNLFSPRELGVEYILPR
jgi:hypothetical protein